MRNFNTGLILTIVLLVALGFLFKSYFDQNKVVDAAKDQLNLNSSQITQMSDQNQVLQSQIRDNTAKQAGLEKAVSAASDSFPAKMNSSKILRDILMLCESKSVTALTLNTSDWASIQIEKRTYSVCKIKLQLSGNQANLNNCIQELQSQVYPALVIENLVLTKPAPIGEPPATPLPPEALFPKVDINIAIYAQ